MKEKAGGEKAAEGKSEGKKCGSMIIKKGV